MLREMADYNAHDNGHSTSLIINKQIKCTNASFPFFPSSQLKCQHVQKTMKPFPQRPKKMKFVLVVPVMKIVFLCHVMTLHSESLWLISKQTLKALKKKKL